MVSSPRACDNDGFLRNAGGQFLGLLILAAAGALVLAATTFFVGYLLGVGIVVTAVDWACRAAVHVGRRVAR